MTPTPDRACRHRHRPVLLLAALALAAALALGLAGLLAGGAPGPAAASRTTTPGQPDLGPNVYVFSPSMPPSRIQATVNSIASQQAGNQFGARRYALLFEPGTYGSAADPLFLQVGYYTSVAGLAPPRATSSSTAPSIPSTSVSRQPRSAAAPRWITSGARCRT